MEWPLKIQRRYLRKVDVDEVKMLLKKNPLWHRTRLSQELCKRWNWRRQLLK